MKTAAPREYSPALMKKTVALCRMLVIYKIRMGRLDQHPSHPHRKARGMLCDDPCPECGPRS